MNELKILNTKETRKLHELINKQWGHNSRLDYAFIKNPKNKIFAVNKDISEINLDKIRINSIGMYFAEMAGNELRLSIEGSQIIGPKATKNVVELEKEEVKKLFRGEDLEKGINNSNFVILKHKKFFLGSGRVKNKR